MPKCKLTLDERVRAIGMLESEVNQIEIAGKLDVAQSVICRLSTQFYQTVSTSEIPR